MATVADDPNLDENEQTSSSNSNSASQPVNVSGSTDSTSAPASSSSAGANTSTSTKSSPSATPAPTQSGSFQNIKNYLQANQNYNNGQGLAGQIGNTLTNQEQTANQNINNASQQTESQANQQAAAYDPNTLAQYAQNVYNNPAVFASNANNLAQWNQYYNGQYTAPTAFDSNGSINNSVQNLQQNANLTQTEPGRMTLLQNLYGTPSYTQGQQSLDNLLLQSEPNQLSTLQQNAGNLSNQLNSNYSNAQQQSQNAINNLQTAAQNGSQALQSGLQNYIGTQENNLNQAAANLQQQRQDQYNSAVSALQNNSVSPTLLAQLGLNAGQQLYNVNPLNYLQNNVGNVTVGNVSTPQDQAMFNALAQLSGQGVNSALGQFANVSSPMQSAVGFDNVSFNNAVNQQSAAYQQALQQLQNNEQQQLSQLQGSVSPVSMGNGPGGTVINNPGVASAIQSEINQNQSAYQQALQNLANQYDINNILKANSNPNLSLGPQLT